MPHRIVFSGEFTYCVKNVAMFGILFSDSEADLPIFTPYTRYDLRKLVEGFYGIEQPIIKEGQASLGDAYEQLYGCIIENSSIVLVPYYYKGQLNIWYKRYPQKIDINANEDIIIDLSPEIAELLPLLIASYVWLEGETIDKAQRYYDLYKQRAYEIENNKKKESGYYRYKKGDVL